MRRLGRERIASRTRVRTAVAVAVGVALFLSACAGRLGDEPELPAVRSTVEVSQVPVSLGAPRVYAPGAPGVSGELGDLAPLADGLEYEVEDAEIYRGTGVFARRRYQDVPSPMQADGDVTLNFANAEIREVVDAVLGQALGLSYIIDPRVQGQITARTSSPIPRSAVIPALENILALNGAALTLDNGVYKVVTLQQAAGSLTAPVVSPNAEDRARGFSIHVMPVRFASARALADILQPFVGPGRVFRVDEARNLLIFAGTGPEARDLMEMIGVFDVDWMAGMSFGLFPIQAAEAKAVVDDLETVFLQDGQSPLAGVLRFVPIERLNAVLVISPQDAYIDQAETWIDRLDRGGEGAGRRIFVYHVQNGRAADLAAVLTQIFDVEQAAVRPAAGTGLAPGVEAVTIGAQEPVQPGGSPTLGEEPAAPSQRFPQRTTDPGGIAALTESGDIRIIADERNNALVILATSSEYRMIEATLKRLDITPLQVLIEVTIAEVRLNDQLRYGLQWFFSQGDSAITFSTLSSGEVSPAFPGFSYLFTSGDARVVLNALTEITDVRVISSPQLMILDNQSARLQVGDQVPIATQSAVSVGDPDAPIVNSIEFRDTGVILEVTPRVNAGGLVTLDVLQEVSDVVQTTTSDLNSPTIQQRSIQSTVAVQTGDTVALGGLIEDSDQASVSGVPLLSEIPILGNLFKTTSNAAQRTELLVLITPRVVRDRREAQDVTEELRKRLTGIAPLELKIKGPAVTP